MSRALLLARGCDSGARLARPLLVVHSEHLADVSPDVRFAAKRERRSSWSSSANRDAWVVDDQAELVVQELAFEPESGAE